MHLSSSSTLDKRTLSRTRSDPATLELELNVFRAIKAGLLARWLAGLVALGRAYRAGISEDQQRRHKKKLSFDFAI